MKTFGVWDYVAFCTLFCVSSLVGLFFAIKDRKKKSTDGYLLGDRQMNGLPVGLSLTASFVSALTIMGTPAEVYSYGTMFLWFTFVYMASVTITAYVFAPKFYELGFSSVYEYLSHRFDTRVRKVGSIVFTIQMCVYMGIVTYMPALALNKVTGLSLILSIVGTSCVCVFYTTLGGLKAVIWTDVLQCSVMIVGFLSIIIQGSIQVGGIGNVFSTAADGGRIDLLRVDADPRVRHSVFSILIGGTFMWLSVYGVNHSMVQRYLCCRNMRQVRIGLFVGGFGTVATVILAILTGLTMYTVYENCDPLASGKVDKSDQLVPYLVMDILHEFQGLPGLFVAVAYSGTLSTVSTGINALACTTLEDFIKPAVPYLSERRSIILSKILVVVYGGVGLGIAFLASFFDGMLTMALKSFGAFGGPLLGIFCLGLFSSKGNSTGAQFGLVTGLAFGFWLMIGSTYYPPDVEFTRLLPTSIEGCETVPTSFTGTNVTLATNIGEEAANAAATTTTSYVAENSFLAKYVYSLSYCHVATVIVLFTWISGYIASLIAGKFWSYPKANEKLTFKWSSIWKPKSKKASYLQDEDAAKSKKLMNRLRTTNLSKWELHKGYTLTLKTVKRYLPDDSKHGTWID